MYIVLMLAFLYSHCILSAFLINETKKNSQIQIHKTKFMNSHNLTIVYNKENITDPLSLQLVHK